MNDTKQGPFVVVSRTLLSDHLVVVDDWPPSRIPLRTRLRWWVADQADRFRAAAAAFRDPWRVS